MKLMLSNFSFMLFLSHIYEKYFLLLRKTVLIRECVQVPISTIGMKTIFEYYLQIRIRTIAIALSADLNDRVVTNFLILEIAKQLPSKF